MLLPVYLDRVRKLNDVHLLLPFRPLLRHFSLTCPGTPSKKFLAENENSAKSASSGVCVHALDNFVVQLGQTKEPYGFDRILGVDFLSTLQLNIDFKYMVVRKP